MLQEQALDYLIKYTVDEIKDISRNNKSDEYKTISKYVARIEHFCVGVNLKIYDYKTVFELAGGFLDEGIYKRITPLIEKKNFGDNDFYANTHKVINKMLTNKKGSDSK